MLPVLLMLGSKPFLIGTFPVRTTYGCGLAGKYDKPHFSTKLARSGAFRL